MELKPRVPRSTVPSSSGRNAMAIWQDLVDCHGFAGRYASVKRFVRKLVGSSAPEARVVIETAPGEEAQVELWSRRNSAGFALEPRRKSGLGNLDSLINCSLPLAKAVWAKCGKPAIPSLTAT